MTHNLINRQFGRLRVIERAENDKWRRAQWRCVCECGNQRVYTSAILLGEKVCSCGCHRKELIAWHSKARAMRESGAKTKDIAAALGKKRSAVAQALSAYCGVKVKCPIDHQRVARTWTAARKSEFTALWLAGVSTAEIAGKFNLAYEANVSALAAQFKLPPRLEQYAWTPELETELRALWRKLRRRKGRRKPFLIRQIAKHFATTDAIIHKAANRLGLPRRQSGVRVRWTADENQQLRKLWLDNELSVQQIALQLGRTKPAVIHHRPLVGLPPRYSMHSGFQRLSLHAWEGMSKEERRRIPEWRMPIRPFHNVKKRYRRKGPFSDGRIGS